MIQQGDELMPEPVLQDRTVRLRRWELADLPCVEAASGDTTIPEHSTVPREFTTRAGQAWIERQHRRVDHGEGWSLAILPAAETMAVGCVTLMLRPQEGVGGLGYWLAPPARGRGLATRAAALVTRWGLDRVGLSRVEAWVEPDNVASVGVLARNAFEREGRLRSFLSFPGRRADALVFSRIAAG